MTGVVLAVAGWLLLSSALGVVVGRWLRGAMPVHPGSGGGRACLPQIRRRRVQGHLPRLWSDVVIVRLVVREFGTRSWFSLVRVDDNTVAMGGLHSPAEAEAWAVEHGHTIASRAISTSGATKTGPSGIASIVAPDPNVGTQPPPSLRRRGWQLPAWPPGPPPPPALTRCGRRTAPAGGTASPRPPAPPRPFRIADALTKESYSCCAATRDAYGRLCIGDCGPDCLRRAARRAS